MSDTVAVPVIDPYLLPATDFNALIARMGVRVAWMRSRSCPCTYAGAGDDGSLPYPGGADPQCTTCLGIGTYWDAPTLPMMLGMSFVTTEPTSREPGATMDDEYGTVATAEPLLTIPAHNPLLSLLDPAQPTPAWESASLGDFFVSVDKLARFVAKLQVGRQDVLPYQQNLQIASTGAVAVYDVSSRSVVYPGYSVSGATVTLPGYPEGTAYMVEFQAAPIYVAWRRAGGLAHVRDFGGSSVGQLPKRFRLQTLDWWTRQRYPQATAAGSLSIGGSAVSVGVMSATAELG